MDYKGNAAGNKNANGIRENDYLTNIGKILTGHKQYMKGKKMKKEYTEIWKTKGIDLIKFDYTELIECGVQIEVVDLLVANGLPKAVAPGINFRKFDLKLMSMKEEKYLPLGFTANGDNICLNKMEGKIVVISHENGDIVLINNSISQMYECLTCYTIFIDSICKKNGKMAFIKKDFTNEDIDRLSAEITQIDSLVMKEGTFWHNELIELYQSIE